MKQKQLIALVTGAALLANIFIMFGEDAAHYIKTSVLYLNDAHAATSTGAITLSTTVQETITLTLSTTTVQFGNLTPGTPIATTSTSSVLTNAANGFSFQVRRNNSPTSTLVHTDTSTQLPDGTVGGSNFDGNASTTTSTNLIGANLHFKVAFGGTDAGLYYSSLWGGNDTDGAGNAEYAGFATTSFRIASSTTFIGTTSTVVTRYRLDSPITQKAGVYSGGITYTAYTNP